MIIRRERPEDRPAILEVIRSAFRKENEEPIEVGLTTRLFDDGYIPALSLVALIDEQVVGYIIGTRGTVIVSGHSAGSTPAGVGVGPLAVLPDYQGRGVGTGLMYALIGAASALDVDVLALLGEPEYYSRFGFRAASELGVESPDPQWGHYFQALRLTGAEVNGTFRYAQPFDEL